MTGYGIRKLVRALLSVLTAFLLVLCTGAVYADAADVRTAKLTILQTGDLHGMLWAYDYTADTETDYGLTKAATIIKNERARDPDLILLDTGDFIQGNFQSAFWDEEKIPMIEAMNLLDYDVILAGGQELGAGSEVMEKIRMQAEASVFLPGKAAAEGDVLEKNGVMYRIAEVKGIRAAIFGWNPDSDLEQEEFGSFLTELESEADVIIGLVHVGDGQTGAGWSEYASRYADKIDVLFLGHVPEGFAIPEDYQIPVVTAGEKGSALGKCVLTLEEKGGEWEVTQTAVSKLSVTDAAPDGEMLSAMEEVHKESLALSDAMIGRTRKESLGEVEYVVKSGDVLGIIAREFGVSVQEIVRANQIEDADRIMAGQILVIPAAQAAEEGVVAVSGTAVSAPDAAAAGEEEGQAPDDYYIVKAGDTLSEIGLRYGCSLDDLVKWNEIEDANQILIGSRLKVTEA